MSVIFDSNDGVTPGITYKTCIYGLTASSGVGIQQTSLSSCTTATTCKRNIMNSSIWVQVHL